MAVTDFDTGPSSNLSSSANSPNRCAQTGSCAARVTAPLARPRRQVPRWSSPEVGQGERHARAEIWVAASCRHTRHPTVIDRRWSSVFPRLQPFPAASGLAAAAANKLGALTRVGWVASAGVTGSEIAARLAFNRDAQNYDQARPGYPKPLYELLANECGLRPGCRVLEIGAGSGQATGRLLQAGAQVVAVEPGAQLAAVLAQRFAQQQLEVRIGDFETVDLAGPFDLAVAATSFHWVDLTVSLPKLSQLLRPGGWLAIWWNLFQDPARPTTFRAALDRVYQQQLPELVLHGDGIPDRLKPESWSRDLQTGGWFGPVQAHFLPWLNPLTPQRARNLWATFSNIIALDPDRRERFLDVLATVVQDEFGGRVDDPCVTAIYLARRRPRP